MHTILVIDDDAACRDMVSGALRKQGFTTAGATDAAAALKLMESQRPDLVLLEVQSRGVNGTTYLQAVRRDARFRRLPVIVLTGSASKETVQNVLQLGVQGYLLKGNLSLDELVGRIKRCLAPDLGHLIAPAARAG